MVIKGVLIIPEELEDRLMPIMNKQIANSCQPDKKRMDLFLMNLSSDTMFKSMLYNSLGNGFSSFVNRSWICCSDDPHFYREVDTNYKIANLIDKFDKRYSYLWKTYNFYKRFINFIEEDKEIYDIKIEINKNAVDSIKKDPTILKNIIIARLKYNIKNIKYDLYEDSSLIPISTSESILVITATENLEKLIRTIFKLVTDVSGMYGIKLRNTQKINLTRNIVSEIMDNLVVKDLIDKNYIAGISDFNDKLVGTYLLDNETTFTL